jgi:ribosomal protein L23
MFEFTKILFSRLPPFVKRPKVERPVVKLPNIYFTLLIPSILKPTNIVEFRVPLNISKPEIKDYLKNYYQLPVSKVTTVNYRGRLYYNSKRPGTKSISGAYKKAYVHLYQTISVDWNEEVKREIGRYHDRRMNKLLKKQQSETQTLSKEKPTETQE